MRRRSGGRRRPQDASTLALSGLFGTVPRRRWGGGRPLGGLRLGIACIVPTQPRLPIPPIAVSC